MKTFLSAKTGVYYKKYSDALPLRLLSVLVFIIGIAVIYGALSVSMMLTENSIYRSYSLIYIISFLLSLASMIITLINANRIKGRASIIFLSVPCCIAVLTSLGRIFTDTFQLAAGIKSGATGSQIIEFNEILHFVAYRREAAICIAVLTAILVVLYPVTAIKNTASALKIPIRLSDVTFVVRKDPQISMAISEKKTRMYFNGEIVPIYPLSTLISVILVFMSLGIFLCSWHAVLFSENIKSIEIYIYAALSFSLFLIAFNAYNSGRYSIQSREILTIVLLLALIARIIICRPAPEIEMFEKHLGLKTVISPVIILAAELIIPAFYVFFIYIYQQAVIKKSGYKTANKQDITSRTVVGHKREWHYISHNKYERMCLALVGEIRPFSKDDYQERLEEYRNIIHVMTRISVWPGTMDYFSRLEDNLKTAFDTKDVSYEKLRTFIKEEEIKRLWERETGEYIKKKLAGLDKDKYILNVAECVEKVLYDAKQYCDKEEERLYDIVSGKVEDRIGKEKKKEDELRKTESILSETSYWESVYWRLYTERLKTLRDFFEIEMKKAFGDKWLEKAVEAAQSRIQDAECRNTYIHFYNAAATNENYRNTTNVEKYGIYNHKLIYELNDPLLIIAFINYDFRSVFSKYGQVTEDTMQDKPGYEILEENLVPEKQFYLFLNRIRNDRYAIHDYYTENKLLLYYNVMMMCTNLTCFVIAIMDSPVNENEKKYVDAMSNRGITLDEMVSQQSKVQAPIVHFYLETSSRTADIYTGTESAEGRQRVLTLKDDKKVIYEGMYGRTFSLMKNSLLAFLHAIYGEDYLRKIAITAALNDNSFIPEEERLDVDYKDYMKELREIMNSRGGGVDTLKEADINDISFLTNYIRFCCNRDLRLTRNTLEKVKTIQKDRNSIHNFNSNNTEKLKQTILNNLDDAEHFLKDCQQYDLQKPDLIAHFLNECEKIRYIMHSRLF